MDNHTARIYIACSASHVAFGNMAVCRQSRRPAKFCKSERGVGINGQYLHLDFVVVSIYIL